MAYALDKNGTLAANKITGERVSASGHIANTAVVPAQALFYRNGTVIRTGPSNTGQVLKEGIDFNFILPCTTLMAYWGRPIYGGIFLLTAQYRDLYFTYQTVGGVYSRNGAPINLDQNNPGDAIRKTWEGVFNVPEPAKADLTLHMGSEGTMQGMMNSVDGLATEIIRLGKI